MNYKYVLAAVCVLLLVLMMFRSKPVMRSSVRVSERQDSALVAIDKTPPKLHLRGRLRSRGRSLILDTVVDHDTVCVYIAPDSTIEIRLLPAPRIVQEWVQFMRHDSIIYQTATEFIQRPWYESPMLVVVGALVGFLIAILI